MFKNTGEYYLKLQARGFYTDGCPRWQGSTTFLKVCAQASIHYN